MIINRKKPNVHRFLIGAPTPDNTMNVVSLRLNPGVNRLDASESLLWEKVKNDPEVLQMMEDGEIEILSETLKTDDILLSKLSPKKASKVVAETFNLELLQQWEVKEKRPLVNKAILKQIHSLVNTPSPEEEKEELEE